MKRFLCLIMILTLLWSTLCPAVAAQWQADTSVLMDAALVPKSHILRYDPGYAEGATLTQHEYSIQKISAAGMSMRVTFVIASDRTLSDGEWAAAEQWLDDKVSESINGVSADPQAMARTLGGAVALGAHDNWRLQSVEVQVPYYTEAKSGDSGNEVKKLQNRLIVYGFLDGEADGSYGGKTVSAVKMLERYIRELEQDVIDANFPSNGAAGEDTPQYTPMTEIDGAADAAVMAYFFSNSFILLRKELQQGSSGIDVERLQTRLIHLGYLEGKADGIFGEGVTYALKLFQYYNGLSINGNGDKKTMLLLFSDKAQPAKFKTLTLASTGEEVKKLQSRLKILGFTNAEPDGHYGANTAATVKILQQYMIDKGLKATAQDGTSVEPMVNGLADCLLLEAFYSDKFPVAGSTMQNGSSGGDVERLQRRLKLLKYIDTDPDGKYGNDTAMGVSVFQKRHGLSQTGVADAQTQKVLFSENAKESIKPYLLRVSIAEQRVYVYTYDENGEYTQLLGKMVCSTGRDSSPTPTGTFKNSTGPGARWHYFTKFQCWAQYAFYIQGDIMFHSIIYKEKDGAPNQSSIDHLGSKASHGCVRLAVEDAKWIWQNCPNGTPVIVE